jgi:PKD repeat protein
MMAGQRCYIKRLKLGLFCLGLITICFSLNGFAYGLQNPQSGSLGLEAIIPSAPPTIAATIAVPSNGQSFSSIPITVSGICPSNLLIEIFDNSVFVGSTVCVNGSYSLKIDLFNGSNSLYAQDYDALGQGGPLSNTVIVTFTSSSYTVPGSQVIVTSSYADLGANPGQVLNWPINISGGTPPYAISTDWGDGQLPTLQSSGTSGTVTLKHTYSTAGTYSVTVTVTDNNGSTAFLQLVAIANGKVSPSSSSTKSSTSTHCAPSTTIPWWVLVILLSALVPAFWLGNRYGQSVIRRKIG